MSNSFENLLVPISGENPSGENLRYDVLYDKIREARREDDPLISRGIWQFELKKSDWPVVEKLSAEALMERSKDLQIAGWLSEAWLTLEGIPGLTKSFDLITKLCQKFWSTLYPEMDDGDLEFRIQLFDWYDHTLSKRLVEYPIINPEFADRPISLAEWMSAFRFDNILKQSTDSDKLLAKAIEKGQLTLKQFYAFMKLIPTEVLKEKLDELEELQDSFDEMKETLNKLMVGNTLAFNELKPAIDDVVRIHLAEYEQRIEKHVETIAVAPPTPVKETKTTEKIESPEPDLISQVEKGTLTHDIAYKQLREIADFLEKTEPHSPAVKLLRRIISWENKDLMDILAEMGSTPDELMALMKFLGIMNSKAA